MKIAGSIPDFTGGLERALFARKTSPHHYAAAIRIKDVVQFLYFALFADIRSRYDLPQCCLDMISEKYPASSGISSIRRQTCSLSIPQFSTAEASRLLRVSISLTAFV